MAQKRALSEPPGGFGRAENYKTRVSSSGFSYFVPVEQNPPVVEPTSSETAQEQLGARVTHNNGQRTKVQTSAANTVARNEGFQVSSAGDSWNLPSVSSYQPASHSTGWNNRSQLQQQPQQHKQPMQMPKTSYYATPPLKLNHRNPSPVNFPRPTVPPPKENPTLNTQFPNKARHVPPPHNIIEPNFYNGYHSGPGEQTNMLMPKYSSAGPTVSKSKHGRSGSISHQSRPVPGGFRGLEPGEEVGGGGGGVSKTPPIEGDPTFEQYQNEMQRQIVNKSQPSKRAFNLEDMPTNSLPCLVVLSVSIETMNRLMGRTPKTDVLFEFYGILDSPVNYLPALKAKKFTLRQGRSYINCMHFETDKPMSKVVRNHYMRCVGKWNIKLHAVIAYSARHAKQEEARKAELRVSQHEPEVEKYFS